MVIVRGPSRQGWIYLTRNRTKAKPALIAKIIPSQKAGFHNVAPFTALSPVAWFVSTWA
jgi:hypothetical protein